MKRLLTYGLLQLTILASHFVVSACQDDLPETTEVMMTFTTRAVTQGAASTAPDKERMKDLHVIMLRSDGTIVGNHTEPSITASSVTFTFSTPIKTTGEDFTFLAIANEKNIGKSLVNGNLEIGDKLSTDDIKALTMNASLNTIDALPQTKLWTVHVPQTQNHHVNQTLDFVGSKISVVFNNQTEEPQSLSNIHILGIGSASAGYLFKQTKGDDFVGTQHDASDITFTDVTDLAASATSEELTYYTYPVGSVSSPTLYAKWNGKTYDLPITKVKDQNGNEIDFTSLKRNDHLRIEITLTPAGDIIVNYTIAAWEETPTNIGGEAPTTPENGYHVDNWGDVNDIIIGGSTGGQDWNIGTGSPIKGEEVTTGWELLISENGNNEIPLSLPNNIPIDDYLDYIILVNFKCYNDNTAMSLYGENFNFNITFKNAWGEVISVENDAGVPYEWNKNHKAEIEAGNMENSYIRALTLNGSIIASLKKTGESSCYSLVLHTRCVDDNSNQNTAIQVMISLLTLIKPLNTATQ